MSPASLRRQVGRLLIAGFNGPAAPVELRALAREFGLGGVILFARNIVEPAQVAEVCFEIGRLTPESPAWLSIDQEGGRVARLKAPFTEWPPMATLGRSGDADLARRFARALASEMRAVGITLDFAPVLDVLTNSNNPVIGDRALGDRAAEVGRLGAAIVRGLQEGGIAACGKHFPGHGDTSLDSHLELPLVEHPPERLREVEFVPFREAIAADVAAIMTAHVFVPSLDEERPATLSRRIVHDLLRDELAFEGVIVSDDLEMQAIAGTYDVPSAAVLAVEAGCDALLICSGDHNAHAAALEAIIHAVEAGTLSFGRVEDALRRQNRAKDRYATARDTARPASAHALGLTIGREEHQAVAHEMARFL